MKGLPYPTILFDWGDTVMRDDPASNVPMVEWESVEAVEGIEAVLDYLHASGRRITLATSAAISDEGQIRSALGRAGLDVYFSRIFCFKNTGLSKGEAFYRYILEILNIPASEALMVGDSFEKDVMEANKAGIAAIWLNYRSEEVQSSISYASVYTMGELLSYFKSLDQS